MTSLHGTAVSLALGPLEPLLGVLLLGDPGSGKSRLAAELIAHCPFQRTGLVADDLLSIDDQGRVTEAPNGPLLHIRDGGIARVRAGATIDVGLIFALQGQAPPLPQALETALIIALGPAAIHAAAVRLLAGSLASGETLWCGFEPGP